MAHDVVIVGAGSAGCVLASRLSEDPSISVLLLEVGGPDRHPKIRVPAAFSELFKTSVDWDHESEPQAELDGRRLFWPRGKVLGGSSSINAMIYARGHRSVFDEWEALGNPGWGWDEVLPYFKRSQAQQRLGASSAFHGVDGPLWVSDPRDPNPLSKAFVDGAVSQGLPLNGDFNGPSQEGVGYYQVTQKQGRRHSASEAFLRPALGRANLTIKTGVLVSRLSLERGRARGVEILRRGRIERIEAGEVILCAGVVGSPHLLMLSGLGSAAGLEAIGIEVVSDLPGVGENLQDHLAVALNYACREPISLGGAKSLGSLLNFLLRRRGMLTSNVAEAGGFVRVDRTAVAPDLQFHFAPSFYVNHGFDNPQGHGFGLAPTLVRPRSRGRLRLRSSDPRDPPAIEPGYLSDPADMELLVRGLELASRILESAAFDPYRGVAVDAIAADANDASRRAYVRSHGETIYHPVGTCKMGRGPMAVVDAELRVHGIDGLRVADASIMPIITNANTHAPSVMIGEKAADFVRAAP